MVVNTVSKELAEHPGYTIVSTGHSLGGALASLAGVALKANLPDADLKVFTFGQPRTGNVAYADLVENVIGASNIFRAVHTTGEAQRAVLIRSSEDLHALLPQTLLREFLHRSLAINISMLFITKSKPNYTNSHTRPSGTEYWIFADPGKFTCLVDVNEAHRSSHSFSIHGQTMQGARGPHLQFKPVIHDHRCRKTSRRILRSR
jgi:hypothetical protein